GMELSKPVFDRRGNMIMPANIELEEKHLAFLKQKGAAEIMISDNRVGDITIKPLVNHDMQRDATEALRSLLSLNRKGKGPEAVNDSEVFAARLGVEQMSHSMVKSIIALNMGEPDIAGTVLVEDFHFVQPVQSACLTVLLAKEYGFEDKDLLTVGRAAMLQNLGYVWLPSKLWHKDQISEGKDRKEFEKHPTYGAEALMQCNRMPPEVIEAVQQHHERWDGSGYPNGLRGWDISPFAQLIAIAESYYELVSARPDRGPYKPADAFEYIMAFSGELFDPELVQIFSRRVPMYPSGIMVQLNTGEQGIIVNVNLGHVGRPTVRICYDLKGNEVYPPFDTNLTKSEHQHKLISQMLDI
ncbi:MAG: HD domain-containing phosphohydrolase, partial [Chloroflexota bacterium]|nr:HD domain-containing phosphohydrolase [Chloroflexota bacterium]